MAAPRKFAFDFNAVKDRIQKDDAKKGYQKDERFWTPTKDAEGNAFAVIRFLPDMNGNPFIKYYAHSFDYLKNGEKKYWIKNCINTFGYEEECPICKKNMTLWDSAFESDKKLAGKQGRKLHYVSNILIVNDTNNPENNGKVMLFRYGRKIYEKIKKLMFPTEQDLADPDFVSYVPFDLYEGADFKLKVKKQGDFPNYDDSSFAQRQTPVAKGDDDAIAAIMEKTVVLDEFLDRKLYPENDETIKVLGEYLNMVVPEVADKNDEPAAGEEPAFGFQDNEPEPAKPAEKKKEPPVKVKIDPAAGEDDDVPFDGGKKIEPAVESAPAASNDDDLDSDAEFFKTLR